MKRIMIQKITQNNWNFWTVNLIMRAKKLLTTRQIFRYAVPARTVTKKHYPFVTLSLADFQKCMLLKIFTNIFSKPVDCFLLRYTTTTWTFIHNRDSRRTNRVVKHLYTTHGDKMLRKSVFSEFISHVLFVSASRNQVLQDEYIITLQLL